MILVRCAWCGEELAEPGALVFSPPSNDDKCCKFHLCTTCYPLVLSAPGSNAPELALPQEEKK